MFNILILIDFSEASKTALKLAFEWYRYIKSKVTLLHAYRLITDNQLNGMDSAVQIKEQILAKNRVKFQTLQHELDFSYPPDWEFKLELGFIHHVASQVEQEYHTDVVIIGCDKNRISNLPEKLIRIIQSLQSPILLIDSNYVSTPNISAYDQIQTCKKEKFIDNPDYYVRKMNYPEQKILLIHNKSYDPMHLLESLHSLSTKVTNFS